MTTRPGTPRLLRGINDRAALDLLLEHGPLSRSRLGELTGLSKPTASQLLARLEAAGLVRSEREQQGRPGPERPAVRDQPRRRVRRRARRHPDPHPRGGRRHHRPHGRRVRAPHAAASRAGRRRRGSCEASTARLPTRGSTAATLHRLVIGTPGAFDPRTGRLRYARHLPGWHDPDLLDRAGRRRRPCRSSRQRRQPRRRRRAARRRGPQGPPNFVLLWAEEGLGAAIVIDGALHRGATGGAGEVGFLPLPGDPAGPRCRPQATPAASRSSPAASRCSSWPGRLGIRRRRHPRRAVTKRARDARRRATSCSRRWRTGSPLGLAAIVSVLDPELVVLSGQRPAGRRRAAAARRASTSSPPWRWRARRSRCPAYRSDPVLRGALHAALARHPDEVFDTIQSTQAVSQHLSAPDTRR